MASIYEKAPFFKLTREWEAKTELPEVYKLQSTNPRTKYKAEIHKDSGTLGIKFRVYARSNAHRFPLKYRETRLGLRPELCRVWQCAPGLLAERLEADP